MYIIVHKVLFKTQVNNIKGGPYFFKNMAVCSHHHDQCQNTKAVDHLIPDGEEHPYAKWRPKARI